MKIKLIVLISIISISAVVVSKKVIKWNFEDYTKLTYEYSQSTLTEAEFFKGTNKVISKANLIIKIKDKGHADVIFTDMKFIVMSRDSIGNYIAKDTIKMPNQVLFQDLTPNGSIEGNIQQSNLMLVKTLFPIIDQKMKLGKTYDIEMSMPFNIFGSSINVKGNNKVTYESSRNNIEELSTIINVSDYTIPEEIEGEYVCFLKGKSSFNFDSKKGVFKDGLIKLNMAMGISITDSIDMKKTTKMIMDMNTEIKLKLIKIE
ncbi:MAG: hypothetical protein HRT66_03840 [Flavobacteriaceae bacterium]|nr:hypothetical protein [Flavobacteriaceae bacterium]